MNRTGFSRILLIAAIACGCCLSAIVEGETMAEVERPETYTVESFTAWWNSLSDDEQADVWRALAWFGDKRISDSFYEHLTERRLWPPPLPDDYSYYVCVVTWGGDCWIAGLVRLLGDPSGIDYWVAPESVEGDGHFAPVFGQEIVDIVRDLSFIHDDPPVGTYVTRYLRPNYWPKVMEFDCILEKHAAATGFGVEDEYYGPFPSLAPELDHFHFGFLRTRRECGDALAVPLDDVASVHLFTPGFFRQSEDALGSYTLTWVSYFGSKWIGY